MAGFHPLHLLFVVLGGGMGAGLRFLFGRWALGMFGPNYPWGTLGVNIIGSFAMGVLAATLARTGGSEQFRLFIGVGVLGGFTTFSAFSLELYEMLVRGDMGSAFTYLSLSLMAGVCALWLGILLVRTIA